MERLKHEANTFCSQAGSAVLVERREIGSVEHNMTTGWQIEPCQQCEQCRFTRTGWAHDRNRITRQYAKADVRKNSQTPFRAANLLTYLMCFEHNA